jgi:hypothetical protein
VARSEFSYAVRDRRDPVLFRHHSKMLASAFRGRDLWGGTHATTGVHHIRK